MTSSSTSTKNPARSAPGRHDELALALAPAKTKLKPPPLYKVILLNDDYTPMDFVVHILQVFFGKNKEQATRVMLQVHTEGRGVCGKYPADIAATKVAQVTAEAREHQHPLQCVMEEE